MIAEAVVTFPIWLGEVNIGVVSEKALSAQEMGWITHRPRIISIWRK